MNPRDFIVKRRTHLVFLGAFLLAIAFNITIGLMGGESFAGAAWKGLSEIRPMDYIMLALFWYACVSRPKDEWETSVIALNLSGSNRQK